MAMMNPAAGAEMWLDIVERAGAARAAVEKEITDTRMAQSFQPITMPIIALDEKGNIAKPQKGQGYIPVVNPNMEALIRRTNGFGFHGDKKERPLSAKDFSRWGKMNELYGIIRSVCNASEIPFLMERYNIFNAKLVALSYTKEAQGNMEMLKLRQSQIGAAQGAMQQGPSQAPMQF